jgi:hypothetical protein
MIINVLEARDGDDACMPPKSGMQRPRVRTCTGRPGTRLCPLVLRQCVQAVVKCSGTIHVI